MGGCSLGPSVGPTWVGCSARSVHFLHKKRQFLAIFGLRTTIFLEILVIFCKILGFSWKSFDFLSMDLQKTGSKLILVAGGSLDVIESTSFSVFQAKLPPSSLPGAQETPQTLPGGFWKLIVLFLKFLGVPNPSWSNLLAVTRCRFAAPGDGEQCLMVS